MVTPIHDVKQRIRDKNRYAPDIGKQAMAYRPFLFNSDHVVGLNPTVKMPGDLEIDHKGEVRICR
jgi:hypothetical protein